MPKSSSLSTGIVRAVLATGFALGACKGDAGTAPATPYPYNIVFERREGTSGPPDIYLLDLQTGNTQRILASGVAGMHPATSADGSRVAFTRQDAQFTGEIFYVTRDATGVFGGLTNVSNNAEPDQMPAWSPNGQRVAFVSDRAGYQDIFVASAKIAAAANAARTMRAKRDEDEGMFLI